MQIMDSGCGVLPNGNILIASSFSTGYFNTFAIYNATSDDWVYSANQNYFSSGGSVFSIGQRAFVITSFTVYEFHYNNNSFSQLPFPTLGNRMLLGGHLEVPSDMLNIMKIGCKGT